MRFERSHEGLDITQSLACELLEEGVDFLGFIRHLASRQLTAVLVP
jgi:hypothetical protein